MPILSNQRHEKFCLEYFATGNATRAYIAAGYAEKTANVCSSQLLATPKIQARIAELQAKQERKAIDTAAVDAAYVLQGAQYLYEKWRNEPRACNTAAKALELLGRSLKLFVDRVETSDIKDLETLSPEQLDKLYEAYMRKLVSQSDQPEPVSDTSNINSIT